RARFRHAAKAGPAPLARREVLVGDAVANGKWLSAPIGGDAVAQCVDGAGHLVTDDAAVVAGHTGQRAVAPPDVEVGSADVGSCHANDDGAWFRFGDGEVDELHRLAWSEEKGGPTGSAAHAAALVARCSSMGS